MSMYSLSPVRTPSKGHTLHSSAGPHLLSPVQGVDSIPSNTLQDVALAIFFPEASIFPPPLDVSPEHQRAISLKALRIFLLITFILPVIFSVLFSKILERVVYNCCLQSLINCGIHSNQSTASVLLRSAVTFILLNPWVESQTFCWTC